MKSVPSAIMLQNVIAFRTSREEMNDRVRFVVYRDRMIFDDVTVQLHGVFRYDGHGERFATFVEDDGEICIRRFTKPIYLCKKGLNTYLVSTYVAMLSNSYVYRKSTMKVLKQHFQTACDRPLDEMEHLQIIFVRLRAPRRQFLDYKWQVLR